MREVKFRGKCISAEDPLQRWIVGTLATWTDTYGNDITCIVSGNGYHNHVSPGTVNQYTGLKDRNGREIYEDDIIELVFNSGNSSIEYIAFKNGRFVTIDPQKPYRDEALCVFVKYATVIGNIHDNPGLIAPR